MVNCRCVLLQAKFKKNETTLKQLENGLMEQARRENSWEIFLQIRKEDNGDFISGSKCGVEVKGRD